MRQVRGGEDEDPWSSFFFLKGISVTTYNDLCLYVFILVALYSSYELSDEQFLPLLQALQDRAACKEAGRGHILIDNCYTIIINIMYTGLS